MNVQALISLADRLPTYRLEAKPHDALRRKLVLPGGEVGYQYSIMGVMADVYVSHTHLGEWEPAKDSCYCDKFYLRSKPREFWTIDIPDEVLLWYGVARDWTTNLWLASTSYDFSQIGQAILKWVRKQQAVEGPRTTGTMR